MNRKSLQKRLLGVGALVVVGALISGSAFAQDKPGRFARGIRAAMATLDLSADQKGQIKEIFASHKGEGLAFREQVKADRLALKAAASAEKPDAALVGTAFLKVRADGQGTKAKMQAVRAEIDAVLTPEQRAKLDGWIAAHKQQRRAMFGGGLAEN